MFRFLVGEDNSRGRKMKQLKDLIDSDKNKASESEYQSAMSQAIELLVGLGILKSPQTDIKGLLTVANNLD